MIDVRFRDATMERSAIRDRFDLLLGVIATLEIFIDNRLLYREVSFPIVELVTQISRWLLEGLRDRQDFEFSSMEHDEPGLVWLRWIQDEDGWRIGSLYQEYPEPRAWKGAYIEAVFQRFIDDVDNWVAEKLRVRLLDILE